MIKSKVSSVVMTYYSSDKSNNLWLYMRWSPILFKYGQTNLNKERKPIKVG